MMQHIRIECDKSDPGPILARVALEHYQVEASREHSPAPWPDEDDARRLCPVYLIADGVVIIVRL